MAKCYSTVSNCKLHQRLVLSKEFSTCVQLMVQVVSMLAICCIGLTEQNKPTVSEEAPSSSEDKQALSSEAIWMHIPTQP